MKSKHIWLLAMLCSTSTLRAQDARAVLPNATNQFQITGMSCDGCARGLASELRRMPGVISADVTFGKKLAVVAYDTNRVAAEGLKKTIIDAGYAAKLIKPQKAKRH